MTLKVPMNFGQVIASIRQGGDSDPYAVTFGVDASTENSGDEMVAEIGTAFRSVLKSMYTPQYTLGPVTLRIRRDEEPAPLEVFIDATQEVGTGATTGLLPQNCAVLIHKRTNLGGRHGRGRFYFPGIKEGVVNDLGVLDTSYMNAWQAAINTFKDQFELVGGDIESGLWLLHNDVGINTPPPTRITAFQVDPVIATQRRRLRK